MYQHDFIYGDFIGRFNYTMFPDELMDDPGYSELSVEALLLYSFMLRRVHLSRINGWIDSDGRTYIVYPINEIMQKFRCAEHKAVNLLKELEEKGDLIVKKRQGLGMATKIYVKDFSSKKFVQNDNSRIAESAIENCQNSNRELSKAQSVIAETTIQELPKAQGSNKDINYKDNSYTDISYKELSKEVVNINNGHSGGSPVADMEGHSMANENDTQAKKTKTNYSDDFQRFWEIYPRKDTKAEAFKCFKTRMGEGFSPDDMIKAAQVYADDCKKRHREKEYTMQPKTFLGPNLRFTDYLPKEEEPKGLEKGKWDPKSGMTPRQWYQCKWTEELGKETGLDVFQWNYGLLN